jgi:cyclase
MREARVIVTVLLDDGGLYKTYKFGKPRYIGDPLNAIKIFNEKYIDEMCILDISAKREGRSPDWHTLKQMAAQAFFPLSYGGGLKCLDDVRTLFSIGFEKVVFTSALIDNEGLVKSAVKKFGQSAVTGYVNVKKKFFGGYKVFDYRTGKSLYHSPQTFVRFAEGLGVGEIIVNSVDHDGTLQGYDWALVDELGDDLSTPIVMSGGAAGLADFKKVLSASAIDSCAGGACFVFYGPLNAVLLNYPDIDRLEAELE